ncbi:DUF4376 domain-containing protein [Neisseria blantyrii]|uniref:DUF4376 domain-containing protein n=1 Tax=Neisseria blantyrii TaxID=2830647 RepID=UPI00272A34C0|nr:DUF4376 domain-containing protein [Neisseria blantyrii]
MTIYYKDRAFYDADTREQAPEGARPITPEQHVALLAALNSGCIVSDDLTISPPRPSEYHEWDGKKWKISKAAAVRKKAAAVAAVWEKIKQKRHENLRGGVYVESVGKWFHNTDEARQQYTFMRTLPQLPPDLQWKTMDGGFVKLTRALLDELSLKLLADEQQNFANAERHRVLMEQSDDPEHYDYSDGWTENYPDQ